MLLSGKDELKRTYIENHIKHLLLLLIIFLVYRSIQSGFHQFFDADKASAGSVLVAVSIFTVLAAFGHFGCKYYQINMNNVFLRLFAHLITGLLMLVIGISLLMTGTLLSIIMGHFLLMKITLVLLYTACIGYDYWDLLVYASAKWPLQMDMFEE